MGAIWDAFGSLFDDFWRVGASCEMALPLRPNTTLRGLGDPRSASVRPLFQVCISRYVLMRFFAIFYDFGCPGGSLWLPFGPPFFGDLASLFRVGAKVDFGCQNDNF